MFTLVILIFGLLLKDKNLISITIHHGDEWSVVDRLLSRDSLSTPKLMFFGIDKPETRNLNPNVAKERIMSDYVFPKTGVYFIKAVTTITGDTPMKIESEPIQIIINEPVGDDLKVWNRIKDNGDFAYFIQQGGTPTYRDEKAEKLLKEVEQIAQKYPSSFLAGQMKQKLEKFRIDEERRREMLEKAKIKPEN